MMNVVKVTTKNYAYTYNVFVKHRSPSTYSRNTRSHGKNGENLPVFDVKFIASARTGKLIPMCCFEDIFEHVTFWYVTHSSWEDFQPADEVQF